MLRHSRWSCGPILGGSVGATQHNFGSLHGVPRIFAANIDCMRRHGCSTQKPGSLSLTPVGSERVLLGRLDKTRILNLPRQMFFEIRRITRRHLDFDAGRSHPHDANIHHVANQLRQTGHEPGALAAPWGNNVYVAHIFVFGFHCPITA